MCGIVGFISSRPQDNLPAILKDSNDKIRHRGPDSRGEWTSKGFAFGMSRLSIIDLGGGDQPIFTEDGVGIVFNGEIYNFQALREELIRSGYRFKTHSDTEVLLNLYHRDGENFIDRVEGMFAICLYDPRQKVAHLYRDRFGIKPLYFFQDRERIGFASEIKALIGTMLEKPALDEEALFHYLTFRYVPGPSSIWKGVQKIEPGTHVRIDLQDLRTHFRTYWKKSFNSDPLSDARNYPKEFEKLFLEAVEKHLVASDVPVGVMLSGGLDSSAVAAAAVELEHRNFHTFNVFFSVGGKFSERPYAQEMAKAIGSRHHEIEIGLDEFKQFLPRMVYFSDEPLADLASVPLHYVSKLAREHVKVVLTGEGSDEILAGYDLERVTKILDLRKTALGWADPLLPENLKWSESLRSRGTHITRHFTQRDKRALYRDLPDFEPSESLIRSWYRESTSSHPLDQLQEVYCGSWLVEDLLMKADKMSMTNSLELRVPFLHHPLAEWAMRLPVEWKTGSARTGYSSKRILRNFARSRLPRSIIDRPKQGFPVPAYEWLKSDLKGWSRDILVDPRSHLSNRFRTSELEKIWESAGSGDPAAAHRAWVLMILELWMREWL